MKNVKKHIQETIIYYNDVHIFLLYSIFEEENDNQLTL